MSVFVLVCISLLDGELDTLASSILEIDSGILKLWAKIVFKSSGLDTHGLDQKCIFNAKMPAVFGVRSVPCPSQHGFNERCRVKGGLSRTASHQLLVHMAGVTCLTQAFKHVA